MNNQPEPIETAPRDGTYFVGCKADGTDRRLCYWDRESVRFEGEAGGRASPCWLDDGNELGRLLGYR